MFFLKHAAVFRCYFPVTFETEIEKIIACDFVTKCVVARRKGP